MEKCPECGSYEFSLVFREEVVWSFKLKPDGDWAWGESEVLGSVPGELITVTCGVCDHEFEVTPKLREFFHSKSGYRPSDTVPITLYDDTIEKLRSIRDEILTFDAVCAKDEYTDTGVVWELLGRWKDDLTTMLGDEDAVAERVCPKCGTLLIALDENEGGEPIIGCPSCLG